MYMTSVLPTTLLPLSRVVDIKLPIGRHTLVTLLDTAVIIVALSRVTLGRTVARHRPLPFNSLVNVVLTTPQLPLLINPLGLLLQTRLLILITAVPRHSNASSRASPPNALRCLLVCKRRLVNP